MGQIKNIKLHIVTDIKMIMKLLGAFLSISLLLQTVEAGTPGAEWYADVLSSFAGNYGNAFGDSMSAEYPVAASGSLENIGTFNLRLLSCENVLGAMSTPFPMILSPDAEDSNINGYGKTPINDNVVIPNYFKKFLGVYKGLQQKCEYAIYDAKEVSGKWTETRKTAGTQSIRISINIGKKTNLEEIVGADKKKKEEKKLVENANLIDVEFCQYEKPKTDSKQNLLPGRQNPTVQKCVQHQAQTVQPGSWGTYLVKTATMRRCSKNKDLCVEATIGTGIRPKFYFKVFPMRHAQLAPNALKDFSDKKKYCEMLKFSFQMATEKGAGTIADGKAIYDACML